MHPHAPFLDPDSRHGNGLPFQVDDAGQLFHERNIPGSEFVIRRVGAVGIDDQDDLLGVVGMFDGRAAEGNVCFSQLLQRLFKFLGL